MWDNISFGQPNWQQRCKMAGLWTANFTPQFAAISKISGENLSLKKVFCKRRRFLHRFMLNMRLLVVWKTYCKLSTHHHLISQLEKIERKMNGLDVWTLKPWPFFHALERGLRCLCRQVAWSTLFAHPNALHVALCKCYTVPAICQYTVTLLCARKAG